MLAIRNELKQYAHHCYSVFKLKIKKSEYVVYGLLFILLGHG